MTGDVVLLGVDGGNTKTIAVAAGPDGSVLGTGRVVRCSDIHAVPVDVALGVYAEATSLALAPAVVDPSRVVPAFSLAGADWPEDVALLSHRLRERWPRASVVNDAIGALRAAIPSGPGVVVVCGTGTATGARGADGRTWHSGFWQEIQGAHELGVRALQAVVRAELGIDPPTALTDAALRAAGEPDVESLLHHASRRDVVDRRDPSALAPVLLACADAGDPTAIEIVDGHGTALGRTAVAAARQVGLRRGDTFSLALTGGVLQRHRGRLRAAIIAAVTAEAPHVLVVEPAVEPVAGALLLAFDAAGIPIEGATVERIEAGIRAASTAWTAP